MLGERTHRARITRVKEIIKQDPAVEEVGDLLTMQLGPEQVLLNVDIRFRNVLDVRQLEAAITASKIESAKESPQYKEYLLRLTPSKVWPKDHRKQPGNRHTEKRRDLKSRLSDHNRFLQRRTTSDTIHLPSSRL